jgi:PRTRC genetic system protein B
MQISVQLGQNHNYQLEQALLIYRDQGKAFVTTHDVVKSPTLSLGPAKMLTTSFVKSLMRSFGLKPTLEILPERVVAHQEDTTVWWMPAQHRQIFFNDSEKVMKKVSGRIFPHPALLFVAKGAHRLYVRALAENKRATGNSVLHVAPYWNTSEDGDVCLGNMRTPETSSPNSIEGWERGFFESAFSHPNGAARLTSYKGGFAALWNDLADSKEAFPTGLLVSTKQTLDNYLSRL